jgi:NADPH:quinone reductase-like Zn-dependent oxidoreductase
MKAALYRHYGPPEVVEIAEVDKPTIKDNEILVEVLATTVNRTDCGFRSAEYFVSRFFSGLWKPSNKILGNEFAGVIESVGEKVKSFRVGDRVFGYNDVTFGAHAEYVAIREDSPVAIIPEKLSFDEAAPLLEGSHYALSNVRAAKVKSGDHVMVYGATGAIGSAAVQLLKYFGAEVTAVCSSPHVDLVKSLGADTVVDYQRQDFTKTNQIYDFIFDAVGKSSFTTCKPLLKSGGIYISTELGTRGDNVWRALFSSFLGSKRVMFPLPVITRNDVLFIKKLVDEGHFMPIVDRYYSLDQIVDAYRYVETGAKVGNVVIRV